MKVTAIVQARMSSQRFPGKVMYDVEGKPLLQYLLERLAHCRSLDKVVVATSTDPSDTVIADFCKRQTIDCYRGSLLNVVERFMNVLATFHLDAFLRVSGDSPLLDPALVDKAIRLFEEGHYEIVTNVMERTYPPGESVEVVQTGAFEKGYALLKDAEDFEHVTKIFYKNPALFRIFNIESKRPYRDIRLSVDTPHDMHVFVEIIGRMDKPHWQYNMEQIVSIYRDVLQVTKGTRRA